MSSPIQQRVAIVTGASGTIGNCIVESLLEHDALVIAASRSIGRLEKLIQTHDPSGKRIVPHQTDVRVTEEARDLIESTIDAYGRIDFLVNAAGIYGAIGQVRDVPPIEWKAALETNLIGAYNCIYFTLVHMTPARSGAIINIAGGGSTGPLEHLSSYAASKAGLVRLTDSLAVELKPHGITANAILPGAIDSPMQDQLLLAGERAGPWYEKIKALREQGQGGVSATLTSNLVEFLLFGRGRSFTGKLISARYDRFNDWTPEQIEAIAGSDLYSTRRLDPVTLNPLFKLPAFAGL